MPPKITTTCGERHGLLEARVKNHTDEIKDIWHNVNSVKKSKLDTKFFMWTFGLLVTVIMLLSGSLYAVARNIQLTVTSIDKSVAVIQEKIK